MLCQTQSTAATKTLGETLRSKNFGRVGLTISFLAEADNGTK